MIDLRQQNGSGSGYQPCDWIGSGNEIDRDPVLDKMILICGSGSRLPPMEMASNPNWDLDPLSTLIGVWT